MPEHFFHELQGADAEALAELNLMAADMDAAIAGLICLRDKYRNRQLAPNSEEELIASSLFHSSVMRFAGCFDPTDKKWRLDADAIFGNGSQEREDFDALRDVRDAFVAHRFGALRQSVVGVAITSTNRRFLSQQNNIYQYPNQDEIALSLKVMEKARDVLVGLQTQAHEACSARFKAMTREEVELMPVAQIFHDVRLPEIRMTRAKFSASRAGQSHGLRVSVEVTEKADIGE